MIVLVTGATAGFGLAIARRFAAEAGARIVAAGRRRESWRSWRRSRAATAATPCRSTWRTARRCRPPSPRSWCW
jgi:NAD(P)-dependent dehydrogenase (short-subunit alcohol dehydrogenase family)